MDNKQENNQVNNIGKILVINGSPRNNASGTMRVTKAFLKGVERKAACDIEIVNLSELNITPCRGCLSCWGRTEGECVIKNDDIGFLREKILAADIVIESFPLYFFGMPGIVKNMTDRLLSLLFPYKGEKPVEGLPYHEFRYNMGEKKLLLISTCGYGQIASIYDALLTQYNCIFGKDNYQALLCPQGRVFSTRELDERSDMYLQKYTDAGEEFAANGKISEETLKYLQVPMFSDRRFELVLNKFWKDEKAAGASQEEITDIENTLP